MLAFLISLLRCQLLHFLASSLTTQGSRRWLKYLSPWYPHGKTLKEFHAPPVSLTQPRTLRAFGQWTTRGEIKIELNGWDFSQNQTGTKQETATFSAEKGNKLSQGTWLPMFWKHSTHPTSIHFLSLKSEKYLLKLHWPSLFGWLASQIQFK